MKFIPIEQFLYYEVYFQVWKRAPQSSRQCFFPFRPSAFLDGYMLRKVFSLGKMESSTYHVYVKFFCPKLLILLPHSKFVYKILILLNGSKFAYKTSVYAGLNWIKCNINLLRLILQEISSCKSNCVLIQCFYPNSFWIKMCFANTHLHNRIFKRKFYIYMIEPKFFLQHDYFYRDIYGRKKIHYSVNLFAILLLHQTCTITFNIILYNSFI